MKHEKLNQKRRFRRRRRVRKGVYGTADRPRLTVTRSLMHVYAQIVDDDAGVTLCEASSRNRELRGSLPHGGNTAAAKAVGQALAERAKAKGIEQVRFDRNGYKYHGRVKELADAAREGGLKF
ncbi:MAG TPA: 50S ribosomal protein L18 [Phycisphaerae bacterium]|nr:50S ribosomal protein L18 [Phycisphaerae bacterium]